MTTLLICLEPEDVPEETRAEIQARAPSMDLLITRDEAAMQPALDDVEIAAGWLSPELVLQMPRVRWAQHWAAGVDSFTGRAEIVAKNFVLTNGSGVHGVPISEHILGLLLAFGRGLHRAIRAQTRRAWEYAGKDALFELNGKTLLLVGVGAIGERTAAVASALGMRVLGVRRDPGVGVPHVSAMFGPDQLREALPQADFVVLTVPLTQATRGMIGEAELRAMRSGAILVNIGRGGTVDEAALARALREGWIAGAGLDVFETEPLPEDSPLWGMENVIITGHYAGHHPRYNERALAIFIENLRRYRDGETLRNVVDMQAGY